jgi:hypothetical protein
VRAQAGSDRRGESERSGDGKDVWLVGSNPRGTAFAAYTLLERLGIDPLYLWKINPHRSYNDLRAFIACEGHGNLVREEPVGIGR